MIVMLIDAGAGPHGSRGEGSMFAFLLFVAVIVAVVSQVLYWIGGGTGLPFLPDFFS